MKITSANFKMYSIFTVLFLMLSSFSHFPTYWGNGFKTIEYNIQPSSVLEVNGKTNINSFSCTSNEHFESNNLDYRFQEQNSSFYFENTTFNLNIKELDCGKKKINKDLFKALKVDEYPNIVIHLKDVINVECTDMSICGEWTDFEANTDITITCETQPIMIPILVKKTGYR